jgi:ferritin-like metal-binding protein YciE
MQLSTLNDLFVKELRDMYSAERQLVQTLPKMAKQATAPELADAFQQHLGETEQHVQRLEQAFELLDVGSRGPVCKGMKGIIEEGKELIEEHPEPDVLDAGMIAAAQRVEHYEIAAYGTLREYANVLGHTEIATLIEQTLEEEKAADQKLTQLAEHGINAMATNGSDVAGKGGGPRSSTQRRRR